MFVSLKRVSKKHHLFNKIEKGFYVNEDFSSDKWFLQQYYGYSVQDSFIKIHGLLKEHNVRSFGIADSIEQIQEYYKVLEKTSEKFVVFMTPVYRKNHGGFRFHKWGKYIGKHVIENEYLYEQSEMDVIYTFRVLMLNEKGHRPARKEHITRVKSLLN